MERLTAGARFGPYTIEGFIAAGGMGEVYAARDTVYGTPVALKVLHPELHVDSSWRRRFAEEGSVGQTLKHPNVLAARDLVEWEGRSALVMDLARGAQTLSRLVSREMASGLPLAPALQVMLGIVQGVDYAHGKGIVHGDLKPENVLIRGDARDVSTWSPLVTDFGTVGLLAVPIIIDGRPAVVASPRYASPEHIRGLSEVGVPSDIYSLGLLLHFLLCGRHASDAKNVVEAAEHVSRPVPLGHLLEEPESVIAIVRRATVIDPTQRYASCRDMALAIRRVLDALGVSLEIEDISADLATEVMEEPAAHSFETAETEMVDRSPARSEPLEIPLLNASLPNEEPVSGPETPTAPVEAVPSAEKPSPLVIAAGVTAIAIMLTVVVFLARG